MLTAIRRYSLIKATTLEVVDISVNLIVLFNILIYLIFNFTFYKTMMWGNYFTLFRQFLILGYIKIHKKLTETAILHHRYYDFFFLGLFFHLLFKIFLHLVFDVQLYGTFNIILLLLSIYICTMINMYYYVYFVLNKIVYYFFKYYHNTPAEFFYPDAPESEYMRLILPFVYGNPDAKLSENLNKERDRFFLLKPIFLFLISVRYFILREPLFFSAIHILVFINYLQDFNLTLLFMYLLLLQISRLLFFMGPDYERFRTKRWIESFFYLTARMSLFSDGFPQLKHLNSNITYDSKIIPKFTINNINLMMYFALRKQLSEGLGIELNKKETQLSRLLERWQSYDWTIFKYSLSLPYVIDNWFYNFCWYIPQIYQDCQRFVNKNQFFWLALFGLILYFENTCYLVLIKSLTPEVTILPIELVDTNIYSLFSFDIVEVYHKTFHFEVSKNFRLWAPFSVEYIYEITKSIDNTIEYVSNKIIVEFRDPRFLGKLLPERTYEMLNEYFDVELRNLDVYERPRTLLEYIEYRVKRRLMWLVACALHYFAEYVPMILDYLVIAREYIEIAIEYIKKIIQYFKK